MSTPFSEPSLTTTLNCIGNSSSSCDELVTKACVGSNSITCACVNSPVPCATTSYSLCSNNPLAYKPYNLPIGCSAPLACTNTISTSSNTLVDETMQICSAEQPVIFNLIYIVLFFVIVAILVVITTIIFTKHTVNKII